MKQLITLLATAIFCTAAMAQAPVADTVKPKASDTIRIGNIVIIKKGWISKKNRDNHKDGDITLGRNKTKRKQNANVSTNWWIVDLGFSNYTDKTNYATAGSYLVNKPGSPALAASDFKVKSGKSVNVNIWFFMQRLNLIKHYVNLKYGFGLELNNYAYKSSLSYKEDGKVPYTNTQTNAPFIFRDSISFSKNKLAADYLTVPFMINFTSNPSNSKKALSLSAGVSAGYLYSQRNKQKSSDRGKDRNKGDYDLERFKLSYIAELGLGPVKFYGSYSPKSFYEHSLDMRPYTLGIRLSNF
jgi:Outer membrane protein beta-barrel domain